MSKQIKLLITASAGTGKTYRLAQIYKAALQSGHPSYRIAATSYTNRAAAEIRSRLLEEGAPEEVADAPIETVHALFRRAIATAPFAAGVDPDFELIGPQTASAYFLEAARTEALLAGTELDRATEERLQDLFQQRVLARKLTPASETEIPLLDLYHRAERRYRDRIAVFFRSPSDLELDAYDLATDKKRVAGAKRVQARLARVLIDEAQDTSPLQHETIRRLFGHVVAVGDPKQAIYRFRQADPRAFEALASEAEKRDALRKTWRHGPNLASFLNAFVKDPKHGAWTEEAATEVVPAEPKKDEKPALILVEGPRVGDARFVEADLVARKIQKLHEEGIPYDEILVLVRQRNHADELMRALDARNIPYTAPTTTPIFERYPVRDLLALLHVLAGEPRYEEYATLITSSALGTGRLADIEKLNPEDPENSFANNFPELHAWVRSLREKAREGIIHALLDAIENPAPGHDAAFIEYLSSADLDAVLFTLAQVEQARTFAEAALIIERLRVYADENQDLKQARGKAVEIMTIHGAKGLQARVVFVYESARDLIYKLEKEPPPLIVDYKGRVTVRENPNYEVVRKVFLKEEKRELRRLLYVALSRAKERLYITAALNSNPRYHPAYSFLHMLGTLDDKGFTLDEKLKEHLRVIPIDAAKYRSPALPFKQDQDEDPLAPTSWLAPYPEPKPAVLSPSAAREEDEFEVSIEAADPEAAIAERNYALVLGTLVHAGIERGWDPDDPGFLETLRAERIFLALDTEDRERAAREIAVLLRSYREMLERGQIAPLGDQDHRELPFAYRDDDGQVWEGVIDRLVQVPDGTWWIEDFKTDHEVHPEHYALQMGVYKAAARAFLGVEPRARLVYLRHRRAIEV